MVKAAAFVFSFSLALAIISMPANACLNIPSMDIAGACRQASTSPRMYDLCTSTLTGAVAANGDVLSYAMAAASAATRSYGFTVATCTRGLAGDAKAACDLCTRRYGDAGKLVDGVVGDLRGCLFGDVRARCVDAIVAVDDCATAVMAVTPGVDTPLHAMALDDRDRTVLALRLISLFFTGS